MSSANNITAIDMSLSDNPRRGGSDQIPDIIRGIFENDIDEINSALERDKDCINECDPHSGKSPLSLAITLQNIPLVRHLATQPRLNPFIQDDGDKSIDRPPYDSVDWAIALGQKEILSIVQNLVDPSLATELEILKPVKNVSRFRLPENDL